MTVLFDENARVDFINSAHRTINIGNMKVRDCVVKEIPKSTAREYISMFHYSKTFPDSTLYCYAAFYNNEIVGVVTYGMGCGKNQFTAIIPSIKNGEYLELTRLWCSDLAINNIESYLISHSLKMLPQRVKLVISFSDEAQGHCGIVYQASNFYYLGKNNGGKMLMTRNGIPKHPRLLGIYRKRHPELKNISNSELLELLGLSITESGNKYRYVYLRGGGR